MHDRSILVKYSYLWATLVIFVGSFIGHWTFAWYAYVNDQKSLGEPVELSEYLTEVTRDTLENWQSEFLQLMWQVGGLALLFYVGSPSSKEGNERVEEKLDMVLRSVSKDGEEQIKRLDKKYARK